MSVGHNSFSQSTLIIATLLLGGLIFALPFVNMLSTSIKLDEEMAAENYTLLPTAPVPHAVSPYARTGPAIRLRHPADMPPATWALLREPLLTQVRSLVTAWYDRQPFTRQAFATVERETALDTLTTVLANAVLARISDDARKSGVTSMLAEVPRLAGDAQILEAFNDYIPRFALGEVGVRLSDYAKKSAGAAWTLLSGPGELLPLTPPVVNPGQHATLLQHRQAAPVTVRLTPTDSALSTADIAAIDRIYLSLQSDQSWACLGVTIHHAGRMYELTEPLYSVSRQWGEVEFRIPGKEKMPLSGRTFLLLQDRGPSPANTPPFALDLSLTPSTQATAWWVKASRNYYAAFRQVPIARYISTSIAMAILTIILTTFGSSLSAYAFARLNFPGKNILFAMLLATMMIPGQVTMIPNFLIFRALGWYNTLYPLWVPALFGSAFFIFLMRQFFRALPQELEDAARIDGCGFFGTYWHIMLPLIRPTMVTVAIFSFMGSWNNFMGLLIYVNDERMYNLAFGLFKFQLTSGGTSGLMMAGAFVMTLPIIALFFLFQRYFIQGIALTGLGGK